MNTCEKLLGWKTDDVKYLEGIIKELEDNSNYSVMNIAEVVDHYCMDRTDINSYIYATLLLHEEVIKEELVKFYPELESKIQELDGNIYVNYLDSGFDSPFYNYHLADIDKNAATDILKDMKVLKGEKNER